MLIKSSGFTKISFCALDLPFTENVFYLPTICISGLIFQSNSSKRVTEDCPCRSWSLILGLCVTLESGLYAQSKVSESSRTPEPENTFELEPSITQDSIWIKNDDEVQVSTIDQKLSHLVRLIA